MVQEHRETRLRAKNGEGDLVVMDIDSSTRREALLQPREDLLASEQERMNAIKGYSIEEITAAMRQAAREVLDAKRG